MKFIIKDFLSDKMVCRAEVLPTVKVTVLGLAHPHHPHPHLPAHQTLDHIKLFSQSSLYSSLMLSLGFT